MASLSSKFKTMHYYSLLIIMFASFAAASYQIQGSFYQCISHTNIHVLNPSASLCTPNNSSFTPLLQSTAQNLRCLEASYPKPQLIFTPTQVSDIQAAVVCARKLGIQIRVRSGGHDYEGLSYTGVMQPSFIVVDLSKLRNINVDVQSRTAWVQAGATTGELYYNIAEKSKTLAFPAGLYTSLGIGGHITGGAYGSLMRKYGLGADNAIDAQIVDARGRILNRKSMGEDMFWAIRGGAGGSFGIIVSWRVSLVPVPQNVTVFNVAKTLEEGATNILYKWQQVASKLDQNLFINVMSQAVNATGRSGRTISTSYSGLFLGGTDRLLQIMSRSFPELNVTRTDCIGMSWIESVLFLAGYPPSVPVGSLLQGKPLFKSSFKAKSDFAKKPIPASVLEGIWERILAEESARMIMNPFGGMMGKIPEWQIPYPHRKGTLFMIQYVTSWSGPDKESEAQHYGWINELYNYMTPYVSMNPRECYVNYRDLDLGMNRNGYNSVAAASVWGRRYFKNNFYRLVQVKTMVDPTNFFRHEQSIPVMY